MAYRYLEHTADVKFIASGKTLEEAFSEAAKATIDVMYDNSKIADTVEKKIELEAAKIESLLYDFLEELLFYIDSEELLLPHVKDIRIIDGCDGYELSCTLVGDDAGKYETNGDVKAITYSEMDISETDDGFQLTVVLDI